MNEPAFPRTGCRSGVVAAKFYAVPQAGMTLRDYFAGQVINDCIIEDRSTAPLEIQYSSEQIDHFYRYRAEQAYKMADAMLEARKNVDN